MATTSSACDGGPGTNTIINCEAAGDATADLALALIDVPDPVTVESDLIYTLRVTNRGPATAGPGISLISTFSAEVTFLPPPTSTQSCYSPEPRSAICDLGSLAPGETVTVRVIVRPTTVGTLTTMAEVFSGGDANPANNRAQESTAVLPTAAGPA